MQHSGLAPSAHAVHLLRSHRQTDRHKVCLHVHCMYAHGHCMHAHGHCMSAVFSALSAVVSLPTLSYKNVLVCVCVCVHEKKKKKFELLNGCYIWLSPSSTSYNKLS